MTVTAFGGGIVALRIVAAVIARSDLMYAIDLEFLENPGPLLLKLSRTD
jgi:hypothetical protein